MSDKVKSIVWPIAFGVIMLAVWELGLLHKLLDLKPFQLPVPSEIAKTLYDNFPKAIKRLWSDNIWRIDWIGNWLFYWVLYGSYCDIFSPNGDYGGMIIISAFNAIPIVALSPIMNVWFSTGMAQKIGVVTVVCMAAMAINAI